MWLFKPAWMSNDTEKAIKAIDKLTDQRKIASAAMAVSNQAVFAIAVDKLTDERELMRVATEKRNKTEIALVVEKIHSQKILLDIFSYYIADADRYLPDEVWKIILERLNTDNTLLAAIIFEKRESKWYRDTLLKSKAGKIQDCLYDKRKGMDLSQKKRLLPVLSGSPLYGFLEKEIILSEGGDNARLLSLLESCRNGQRGTAFDELVAKFDLKTALWLEKQLPAQTGRFIYRDDTGDLLMDIYRSTALPTDMKEFAQKQLSRIKTHTSPGDGGEEFSGANTFEYIEKGVIS
jgi:hypothetical protein